MYFSDYCFTCNYIFHLYVLYVHICIACVYASARIALNIYTIFFLDVPIVM